MKKVILMLILTLFILGCCGITWPGSSKDEFDMIPKTANVVIILKPSLALNDSDFKSLSGNALDSAMSQVEGTTGINFRTVDRLIIFTSVDSFNQESTYYGYIAKGTIDQSQILEKIKQNNTVTNLDYGGRVMYEISPTETSSNETYLSFIGDNILVAGSKEAVQDLIDVDTGKLDSVDTRGNLTTLYKDLGKDSLFLFMAESSPNIKREISDQGSQYSTMIDLQPLSQVDSLGLSLDKAGKNIDLKMFVLTDQAAGASGVVRVLDKVISIVRSMPSSGSSVKNLLAKVHIGSDQSEVSFNVSSTINELKAAYKEISTPAQITGAGWYVCNNVSEYPCNAYQAVYCDKFDPTNLAVREAAAAAISPHPGAYSANQILDVYDWVHQNVIYQNVPVNLTYEPYPPQETLATGSGDCKNQAVLIASMIEAVGGSARILLIPECQHAFAEVYIGGNDTKNRFLEAAFAHYSSHYTYMNWHTSNNDTEIWMPIDTAGGSYAGNTIADCLNASQTFVLYNCNLHGWEWKAPDVTWLEYGPFKLYDSSQVIDPDSWYYFTYSVNTTNYDYCTYDIKLTSKARLFDWFIIPANDYYNFKNGYSYHYYYREEQVGDTQYNFTMTKPDRFNLIIKNSDFNYPMTVMISVNERCYKK
jgi:hypothetical protein